MKLSEFLRGKIFSFVTLVLTLLFCLLFLSLFGLGKFAVIFLLIIISGAVLFPMTAEYLTRRRYYNEVQKHLDRLDKKYLITELLDEPDFPDGRILFDVLRQCSKSMNDQTASFRRESREYREYVELWMHEVKTPIASARLLIENRRPEIGPELTDELDRVDYYLEQALFYSRSINPEKDYIIRRVFLEEIVQDVLRSHARKFIRAQVGIRMTGLDVTVCTDVKWIRFILGQLLDNAFKYRAEEPWIHIEARQTDCGVVLTVADNGIGISAEDQPRLFEKGFTGESGRRYVKSTGIGLYLCKLLCDKLEIPITLFSKQGKGTTVQLEFPIDKRIELHD